MARLGLRGWPEPRGWAFPAARLVLLPGARQSGYIFADCRALLRGSRRRCAVARPTGHRNPVTSGPKVSLPSAAELATLCRHTPPDPPELDFRLSSSLNTGTPGRLLAAHHAGQRQGGHGCVLRCQRPGLRCLPVDGFCHLSPGRSTHTAPPGQPDGRGCCPPYVRAQPEAVGSDGHRGGSSGQIQQPARPGIPSSRAVSAGSGGCWVRTSVGQVNDFTDRHLSALPAPGDQPLLAPTRLLALTSRRILRSFDIWSCPVDGTAAGPAAALTSRRRCTPGRSDDDVAMNGESLHLFGQIQRRHEWVQPASRPQPHWGGFVSK